MKTKKLISRSDYLLPQSLEDLHRESGQWLETLAFWKDETRFFADLLEWRRKRLPEQSEYTELLANLDKLHQSLFDYLTEEIMAHERLLNEALSGKAGLADADYRDVHRKIKAKMQVFETDFREFKKMVFGYARKW
jgi:hypothetical protein